MKILGIGAHPDDLEIGCGGLLARMSRSGHKLCMLVLSDGRVGGTPGVRRKEQERSAALLKARLMWGGWQDTEMALDRALIRRVEEAIAECRPDLILVNSPDDTHQDHRAAAQAAVTAARYSPNLLFYEVPTTIGFAPSLFADIGGVLTTKVRLLKCHSSQVYKTRVKNLSIVESARSAAVFRGFQGRVKYAEGFMPQRAMLDSLMGLKK